MPAQKMLDLLKRGEQFHQNLAAYYQRLGKEVRRTDVKHVLEYMQRHEEYLEHCFHEYQLDAPKSVRDAWFRAAPTLDLDKMMRDATIDPEMRVDDVIAMALHFDDCLIQLYRQFAEIAVSENLRDALNTLLEMEREEERKAIWALQRCE